MLKFSRHYDNLVRQGAFKSKESIPVIIPIHELDEDGISRLTLCVDSLRRNKKLQICILDSSGEKTKLPFEPDKYSWHRQTGIYNKSKAINLGFLEFVTGEVFFLIDHDAVVPADFEVMMTDFYWKHRCCISVPTRYLRDGHDKTSVWEDLRKFPVQYSLASAWCLIPSHDFKRINGYDEEYVGWGAEDTDFKFRLGKCYDIEPDHLWAYHQYHPLLNWHKIPRQDEINRERFAKRKEECLKDPSKISLVRGLMKFYS